MHLHSGLVLSDANWLLTAQADATADDSINGPSCWQSGDWQVSVCVSAQQLPVGPCEVFLATHHVPPLCATASPHNSDGAQIYAWHTRDALPDSWAVMSCRYSALLGKSQGNACWRSWSC